MNLPLTFLICSIFVASCTAYLSTWPKKIEVTKANQHEFGLPIGTILRKDKRTGLYIPPPISDEFDPEARLVIQFTNKVTRRNFCRVGPSVEGKRIWRNFFWNDFCRNSDGEDICCGQTKCSCDLVNNNCGCLSKDSYEYFEQKKQKDFNNTLSGIDTVSNAIGNIGSVAASAFGAGK